jgi:hypothetical protein
METIEDLILCCVHSKKVSDKKDDTKEEGGNETTETDDNNEIDNTKGVVIIPYNRVQDYNNQSTDKNNKKPADINIFDESLPAFFRSPLSIAQISRGHYFVTSRVGVHVVRKDGVDKHNQIFSFSDKEETNSLVDLVSTEINKKEIRGIFAKFNAESGGKITSNYSHMVKVSDRDFILSLSVENRLGEEHRKETTYSGLATFLCRFKDGFKPEDQLFEKDISFEDIFEVSYMSYKPTRDIRTITTNTSRYIAVPEKSILKVIKCDDSEGKLNFPETTHIFNFGLDKSREEIVGYDVKDNIAAAVLVHKGDNNELTYSIEIRNDSGSKSYRFSQDNPNSILERPKCVKLIKHTDEEGHEKLYCLVGCYRGAVYTIDCGENMEQAKVTNLNGFLTLKKRKRSNGNSDKHSIKQITEGIKDDDLVLCCSNLVFRVSPKYFIENNTGTYEGRDIVPNYISRAQLQHRCAGFELDCNQ